jgi:hypothetical protein
MTPAHAADGRVVCDVHVERRVGDWAAHRVAGQQLGHVANARPDRSLAASPTRCPYSFIRRRSRAVDDVDSSPSLNAATFARANARFVD